MNYDFESKFKALMGKSRHSIEYSINNGFLNLPKGCYIHMEKQAKEYILRNIKNARVAHHEDYAINERLFHWQSQSRTTVESETGQRYVNHLKWGNRIVLFVSENKKQDGLAAPYTYLGEAEYVSHSGSMPISFVWKLKEEIPAGMIRAANKGLFKVAIRRKRDII